MVRAASGSHLNGVVWLYKRHTEGCMVKAMDCAAGSGLLGVVKWLRENRTEGCYETTMDWAAHSGHLDIVQWLHENGAEGCSAKAIHGHDQLVHDPPLATQASE